MSMRTSNPRRPCVDDHCYLFSPGWPDEFPLLDSCVTGPRPGTDVTNVNNSKTPVLLFPANVLLLLLTVEDYDY